MPALSEPADGDEWDGETGLITDVVKRHETDLKDVARLRLRAAADGGGGAARCSSMLGVPEKRIYYDKFTTTGDPANSEEQERECQDCWNRLAATSA